jgi:hypothetical protein
MTAELRSDTWYGKIINSITNRLDVFNLYKLDQGLVISTSSTFIVDQKTSYDNYTDEVSGVIKNGITGSGVASTTLAKVKAGCNPLSFDLTDCITGLFIPTGDDLAGDFDRIHDSFLVKMPWGYVTRMVDIMTNPATTSLPAFTVNIHTSASSTTALTFDPGDMVAGAGAILDNTRDPTYGKNLKDVLGPVAQLILALGVLFTIIKDLLGMQKHAQQAGKQTKLS